MIPLSKQSKKAQRAFYASQRGSWYGINPVTRVAPNRKGDARAERRNKKQQLRKELLY